MKNTPPNLSLSAFNCPYCGVYALQDKYSDEKGKLQGYGQYFILHLIATSICQHCKKVSIWVDKKLIHPNNGTAPPANPDMPADVKEDYVEASTIATLSPKAAAALLRLAIQKLCKHLGEEGSNINHDIGALVSKGLPPMIQQSLDFVRVIGNNAVHPRQIDADNQETVHSLFALVNLVTETMITTPKHVQTLYDSLPASIIKGINDRDKKKGDME